MFTTDPDLTRQEQLQQTLEVLLDSEYVYFQPPSNVSMVYPCFVYEIDSTDAVFADNQPYRLTRRYQLTIIQRTSDTDLLDKVAKLPMSVHVRSFRKDQLYQHVFNLYF